MSSYKDPKEWGPHFWYMMRCTANNYPVTPSNRHKLDVKRFYDAISNILPCEKCVRHYKDSCIKYPIEHYICCHDCLVNWVEKIRGEVTTKTDNDTTRVNGNMDTTHNVASPKSNYVYPNGDQNSYQTVQPTVQPTVQHYKLPPNNVTHSSIPNSTPKHRGCNCK